MIKRRVRQFAEEIRDGDSRADRRENAMRGDDDRLAASAEVSVDIEDKRDEYAVDRKGTQVFRALFGDVGIVCENRGDRVWADLTQEPEGDAKDEREGRAVEKRFKSASVFFRAAVLRRRGRNGGRELDRRQEQEPDDALGDGEPRRFVEPHHIDDREDNQERDAGQNVLQRQRNADFEYGANRFSSQQKICSMKFEVESRLSHMNKRVEEA